MPPTAKRARSDDGAPTVAECEKMVKGLSKETAHALLAELMASSTEAFALVEAEIEDVEPADLSAYSRKASKIVSSLDGMRASKQFERCGDVLERLVELVGTCKEELSSTDAFAAMVRIVEVVHSEAEGEVRKGVVGDLDYQVAEELENLAEGMSSKQKDSLCCAVDDLEGVAEDGCYGDVFKDAVAKVRGD